MTVIKKKNWDEKIILSKVDGLLSRFDDGELFVEEVFSENILFDDNKVKNASYDQDRGFGLRTVRGDSINFYHSSELNEDNLNHGIKSINKNINYGCDGKNNLKSNQNLYESNNPISMFKLDKKINLLKKINNYARKLSSCKQFQYSNGSYQNIEISKKWDFFYDSRPLVRLNVNISVEKRVKLKQGLIDGRKIRTIIFCFQKIGNVLLTTFNQAVLKLSSKPTPAGEQTVVLGPGWPEILFTRQLVMVLRETLTEKTSAFYDLIGKSVASVKSQLLMTVLFLTEEVH